MIRHLKRLKSSKFVRVKAFPMYGGIGVSAPSLHRESTDSLIKPRAMDWQVHVNIELRARKKSILQRRSKEIQIMPKAAFLVRAISGGTWTHN